MHQIAFQAMGCKMGAWVLSTNTALAQERLNMVRFWMTLVDATLNRFRSESELSRVNALPAIPMRVSPLLWDTLTFALRSAQETDGLYDPTVLDALIAAGYDRDFDTLNSDETTAEEPTLARYTWRDIECDPLTRMVMLPPGVRLDLGGTAKGWAAARAADLLAPLGPCLVNAGGDLAVRGSPPALQGWPIGVADPNHANGLLANLLVRDRGVATSGVDYRRWTRAGIEQHHIIDPHTHHPAATDLRTATVIAPDAAQADLYALVVMILGRKGGLAFLQAHPDLEGLLVDQDGRCWPTVGMASYFGETRF